METKAVLLNVPIEYHQKVKIMAATLNINMASAWMKIIEEGLKNLDLDSA